MATTYRGYDLKTEDNGEVTIHSMGSYPPVSERFQNDEQAMDYIDRAHRERRQSR